MEEVGKWAHGYGLARGLKLPDCQWTNVAGGKSLSLGKMPSDLCLVHGRGRGESAELECQVDEAQRDERQKEKILGVGPSGKNEPRLRR